MTYVLTLTASEDFGHKAAHGGREKGVSLSHCPKETVMSQPKEQEVYRIAHELFSQTPDWVTFFREVLGLEGIVKQAYPSVEEQAEFERTREYQEIQQMLAKLRERSAATPIPDDLEPTRVITVRLPKSLHEALRAEAHERRTSMNKLCISKLLQVVDEQLIPTDTPVLAEV
jgi:predicted HicB family RNase H-like nuclease